MRSQLRKFTLPKLREALEQFFARHQRQHRITKEFQLLVVADFVLAFARLLRFLLPRLRTVCDRLFNDGPAPEMVAQPLFQRRDFPFFHRWGQPLFCPAARSIRTAALSCLAGSACFGSSVPVATSSSAPQSVPEPCRHSVSLAGPSHRATPCPRRSPDGP